MGAEQQYRCVAAARLVAASPADPSCCWPRVAAAPTTARDRPYFFYCLLIRPEQSARIRPLSGAEESSWRAERLRVATFVDRYHDVVRQHDLERDVLRARAPRETKEPAAGPRGPTAGRAWKAKGVRHAMVLR